MSRKELDLDDVRRLLVHVHVPRRRRDPGGLHGQGL